MTSRGRALSRPASHPSSSALARDGGLALGSLGYGVVVGLAGTGDDKAANSDDRGSVGQKHQDAAGDRSDQDTGKRPRLDQRIAGDQLILGQMLGQDAEFQWAEKGSLRAQTDEHQHQ